MRVFVFALLAFLCVPQPASASWHKVRSPNFIVYSEGNSAATIAFTEKVERFDAFLRSRLKARTPSAELPLVIFLVGADQAGNLSTRRDSSIRGFYNVGPNGPMAVVARYRAEDKYDLGADLILFHEYAHHFMYQNAPAAYPAWFTEGFAEFYSTVQFDKAGRASYGRPAYHRGYELAVGDPIPIEHFLLGPEKKREFDNFYGRAWAATHYLMFDSAREGQLSKYLRAINMGQDNLAAARDAFGDLKTFDADISAYVKKPRITYLTTSEPISFVGEVKLAPIDPGEGATVIERLKIMRGTNAEERPAVLAALDGARARFPASAAIMGLRAQLLYEGDSHPEALSAANAALALDPAEPRGLLYKGLAESRELIKASVVDQAKWKAARANIVKANRVQPNNPYPLYYYYLSFGDEGVEPTALAEQGLARAHDLVPQDPDIRFAYARLLVDKKQLEPALALIRPLAFDPHGGWGEYGAKLVKALEQAIASGKPFEWPGGEEPPEEAKTAS